jgi:bacterial microcompartment shell protein
MSKLPAIALIEFGSIAAGTFAADKMVKRAHVELMRAGTVQPGKYLILVGGGTAEVQESHRAGIEAAPADVLDEVLLPDVHPRVVKALDGARAFDDYDSLVVLETSTIAAVLRATDAAVKGARVELAELRLGNGLGGRGVAVLTGELTDVEAAAEIATRSLTGRNVTLCHSIVSNVHDQFASRLDESTRFFLDDQASQDA